jgi:hypothetical protein
MPNLLGSNVLIQAKLLKFPDWVQIKVNQADGASKVMSLWQL